jgi:molecular chaperone GrpE
VGSMAKKVPKSKAQASTRQGSKPEPKPTNPEAKPCPEDVQLPLSELELMTTERDELDEKLAYMQAEFENLKKRSQRDIDARVFRAKEKIFLDILCVMDNMDLALAQVNGAAHKAGTELENFAKGVRMIHQQMRQVLTQHGLEPLEALGQPFDPFRHEALMKVEQKDKPDGIILEEIVKGYTLDGNVIRPTKVKVNVLPKAQTPKQEK